MSRQCRMHCRVSVPMLGGKQMRMIESSTVHDRARVRARHSATCAIGGLGLT